MLCVNCQVVQYSTNKWYRDCSFYIYIVDLCVYFSRWYCQTGFSRNLILFLLVYYLLIQVNTPYSTVPKGGQGLEAERVVLKKKEEEEGWWQANSEGGVPSYRLEKDQLMRQLIIQRQPLYNDSPHSHWRNMSAREVMIWFSMIGFNAILYLMQKFAFKLQIWKSLIYKCITTSLQMESHYIIISLYYYYYYFIHKILTKFIKIKE